MFEFGERIIQFIHAFHKIGIMSEPVSKDSAQHV
jgi:hypothetical protein